LKRKWDELAKRLGHNDFKATDGSWSRRKCRFGIKFEKGHGEKGSADAVSARQWKSTELPTLFQKLCADIYIADETGLLYHATMDGSRSYKHATLSGSKKATDFVTVLCCSNMSGTDKWKLLVIGKRLSVGALWGFIWVVYQFYSMLTKVCGWHLKFLRNG
jgi:hypothetical protein